MKSWEQVRNWLLAATLGSSLLVLGKTIVTPITQQKPQSVYTFPEQIPLPGWQFLRSYPTAVQHTRGPAFASSVDVQSVAGRHYQYVRNGVSLSIEMRFFDDTYVDVPRILEDSTLLNRNIGVATRQLPNLGSYALYSESNQVHLSACTTPYGVATVTDREMRTSQNRPEVLTRRVFPWLLGQAPLRDLRCLWGKMSMTSTASTEDRKVLEQAWTNWMKWWQKNYPQES